jgi:hypothetical protein
MNDVYISKQNRVDGCNAMCNVTLRHNMEVKIIFSMSEGSDANSEPSVSSIGSESVASRNTLLAVDTRGSHIKTAINKITDNMRIDGYLLDPDNLWQRPNVG